MVTVPTARLERAAGGTPYSHEYQDLYHSAQGGLAQARHVFLGGNGLPQRWQGRDSFTIVETGFGLGLNFLAAWDAWRRDPSRSRRLHFVSIESTPFAREDLADALAPFAEIAALAPALAATWPAPLGGFHRMHFDGGQVVLTLLLGDARTLLPQLVARADAFFLDGFAPARNPELWSPEVVRELARLAAPGATLATWTVAGGVRTALADAGFALEKREGFGAKREMLAGIFPGPAAATRAAARQAVVVGSGLAGVMVADRLAARDWEVQLVDMRGERTPPAVGVLRPVANLRDTTNAQISRGAFLYSLQHLRALQHDGYHLVWDRSGVLQLAGDDDEAHRLAAIAQSQGYPASLMEYVDVERAQALAGRRVRHGGWWFPQGAWVSPSSFGIATFARGGQRLRRFMGRPVARVEREGGDWRALDADGRVIAEAPTMIVANGADAKRLLPQARLPLSTVRGQLTYLPPAPARRLDIVVSGSGYIAPIPEGGGYSVGATYQHDDDDPTVRAADHRDNLARAEEMLPGFTSGTHPMNLAGWTGFRTTVPDRLPVFGATAEPGLHVASGLGSRGLLWAPLGAEMLASLLEGEPLPMSRDHAGAISPMRFLS